MTDREVSAGLLDLRTLIYAYALEGWMTQIACAVFVRAGKILLAKRASHKARYAGHWDLVGGHVEPGEPVEAALIREAQEEVGVTPTEFRLLEVVFETEAPSAVSTQYHIYAVTRWLGGDPALLGDEHTDMRWLTPKLISALSPLAHPEYAPIFAALVPAVDRS